MKLQATLDKIATHFEAILDEYKKTPPEIYVPWSEKTLYTGEWFLLPLIADRAPAIWRSDERMQWSLEQAKSYCPKTSILLREAGAGMAAFSYVNPNTHIKPHRGYVDNVTRGHFGLHIPKGDCWIKINDRKRRWHNGKWLLFKDYDKHEIVNNTQFARVVLLADFDTP